jgi:WD40 repeat protein
LISNHFDLGKKHTMTRFLSVIVLLLIPGLSAAAPPPAVTAVAYHPQGKSVVFAANNQLWLFNPDRGELLGRTSILSGRITALAFDPTGKWLAVAGGEAGKSGDVWLFRVESEGKLSSTPQLTFAGHKDAVYALAFSPDGKTLATTGYDRLIHLWDVSPGQSSGAAAIATPRLTLKDHSDTVYGLSFHPDGALLASAGADRAVKVWEIATGRRLYTLGDPTDWVYCVAWSPDKKHLAAGGVDKSVRVWEADKDGGKLVHSVFAHEKAVSRLAYTADGITLYSVGEDKVIKAWDAAKMTESKVYPRQPETVLAMALRPDGKQLAVGRFDGAASLVDTASGNGIAQLLPAKPLPPKPLKLSPAVGVRGAVTKVNLAGMNLDYLKRVTTNSDKVAVKIDPGRQASDQVGLEISVEPNATIGPVQLTFEGDAGKSSPLPFIVDRFASVSETGIADSARVAQAVKLPVSIAGKIDRAGDVDFYRFDAKAGEQIGVQALASELGSKLDPTLVLTDGAGRVLAEGNTSLGFTIPRAGSYAVGIRDKEFRGAGDMTYRLHIGAIPVITGVFPLAIQRGRSAEVHIEGVNLGAPQGLHVKVNVPADTRVGTRIPVPLPMLAEKPLGEAFVLAVEFPSVVMDPVAGAELRVPGSADGILTKTNEAQIARFSAKKGEKLIVEVLAHRTGSPVDSVIEILDGTGKPVQRAVLRCTAKTYVTFRDHDSVGSGIRLETWNELAIDDYLFVDGELVRILALPKGPDDDAQFYQVNGRRVGFLGTTPAHHSFGSPMYKVEIHPPGKSFPPNGLPAFPIYYRNDDGGGGYGKDSFLIFDPPADGTYQVRVTDARGAGGPTHAYRLTVRPPKPDFTASFNPIAPSVWKGGGVPINVTIDRIDGFDELVRVQLENLPAGIHAPPAFIEPGQTTTTFTLFADKDAVVPPDAQMKLVTRTTIAGKEVVHELNGGSIKLVEGGDLVTRTRVPELVIKPGQETRFTVDIERQGKFTGRVPLDVRGLPHGVRVLNIGLNGILITEKETSREVVLYAEPWVQPMEHPLVVLSRSEAKGTEHATKAVMLKVVK